MFLWVLKKMVFLWKNIIIMIDVLRKYYINCFSSFEIKDWVFYFGVIRIVWFILLFLIFWSNFVFFIKLREIK